MARRVSFSNKQLELGEIAIHYLDSESSLKLYFSSENNDYEERFSGYSSGELANELRRRITELSHTSSLSLLATLEAIFRIDYLQRNYNRKKDSLSRTLREIYQEKSIRASLEDDILDAWKTNTHGTSQIISDLKGAYKYRHWLAHGRYWEPKMGRQSYDYDSVYELTETILNSFPFEGTNA
ncbi:MAG: hypothetical protein HFP81_00555 [Methylococcales symbiont of Hymedesmia sp. n. MRB-2018]|nr:MAG: hypothetical protein HFP78_03850 [Methylococcales symbiont of Hymedesmia sp. n. MRB-2018]KAF3984755.1 MAG: hypothetical protein HFP81_00555 [Methylococcales symbiont of Hymedesmia sp. n. MRB-2018]